MSHNIDRQTNYPANGKTRSSRKRKLESFNISLIALIVVIGAGTIHTKCTVHQVDTDSVEAYATVYEEFKSGRGTSYNYRFDVDGKTYIGSALYGCSVGDTIVIRYSRKNPSKNYSVNNGVYVGIYI